MNLARKSGCLATSPGDVATSSCHLPTHTRHSLSTPGNTSQHTLQLPLPTHHRHSPSTLGTPQQLSTPLQLPPPNTLQATPQHLRVHLAHPLQPPPHTPQALSTLGYTSQHPQLPAASSQHPYLLPSCLLPTHHRHPSAPWLSPSHTPQAPPQHLGHTSQLTQEVLPLLQHITSSDWPLSPHTTGNPLSTFWHTSQHTPTAAASPRTHTGTPQHRSTPQLHPPTHHRHPLRTLAESLPTHHTGTLLSTLGTPPSTLAPLSSTLGLHLSAHPYSCPLPTHHRHLQHLGYTSPAHPSKLPPPTPQVPFSTLDTPQLPPPTPHTTGTPQHPRVHLPAHTPTAAPPHTSQALPSTQVDATKKPLQQPYDGPFTVIKRTRKNVTIDRHGKSDVIAIDRVKPAYLLQPDPSPTNTVSVSPTPVIAYKLQSHKNTLQASQQTNSPRRNHRSPENPTSATPTSTQSAGIHLTFEGIHTSSTGSSKVPKPLQTDLKLSA
ncbi:mucin-2-like [Eriocheir sinensis]|uniref:mucin-2-like n=1 Tax=Eriocheir sinensis TaxID=95602 RepID=UPI0021C6870A|nr:mucin-2-like [Eriocheir sinensis]